MARKVSDLEWGLVVIYHCPEEGALVWLAGASFSSHHLADVARNFLKDELYGSGRSTYPKRIVDRMREALCQEGGEWSDGQYTIRIFRKEG